MCETLHYDGAEDGGVVATFASFYDDELIGRRDLALTEDEEVLRLLRLILRRAEQNFREAVFHLDIKAPEEARAEDLFGMDAPERDFHRY